MMMLVSLVSVATVAASALTVTPSADVSTSANEIVVVVEAGEMNPGGDLLIRGAECPPEAPFLNNTEYPPPGQGGQIPRGVELESDHPLGGTIYAKQPLFNGIDWGFLTNYWSSNIVNFVVKLHCTDTPR